MEELKFFRDTKWGVANKENTCKVCSNNWKIGDTILMFFGPFEIYCKNCGDKFLALKDKWLKQSVQQADVTK